MTTTEAATQPITEPTTQPPTQPTTPPATSAGSNADPNLDDVLAALGKRSFGTLATVSPAGRPHVAAVLYSPVDDALYVSTGRDSRKARNIIANPHVAVCIPVRRLPVGPPSSVHFQTTAEVLATDHEVVRALAEGGHLKAITGHGELDLEDGCVLRIALPRRLATFGLGLPLRQLIKDPLRAGGAVERV